MRPRPDFIFVVFLEWHEQIPAIKQKSAIVPQDLTWRSSFYGDLEADCLSVRLRHISRFPFSVVFQVVNQNKCL